MRRIPEKISPARIVQSRASLLVIEKLKTETSLSNRSHVSSPFRRTAVLARHESRSQNNLQVSFVTLPTRQSLHLAFSAPTSVAYFHTFDSKAFSCASSPSSVIVSSTLPVGFESNEASQANKRRVKRLVLFLVLTARHV